MLIEFPSYYCTSGVAVRVWRIKIQDLGFLELCKQLTSWSRALLEKLIVTLLVTRFPAFCGSHTSITSFKRASHWTLYSARRIKYAPLQLGACLLCDLLHSSFMYRIWYEFIISSFHAPCFSHWILLELVPLCSILCPPVTSSLSGPSTLSEPSSPTHSLCVLPVSLKTRFHTDTKTTECYSYEACPENKDTKVLNMYNIFNLQKRHCEWIACT